MAGGGTGGRLAGMSEGWPSPAGCRGRGPIFGAAGCNITCKGLTHRAGLACEQLRLDKLQLSTTVHAMRRRLHEAKRRVSDSWCERT